MLWCHLLYAKADMTLYILEQKDGLVVQIFYVEKEFNKSPAVLFPLLRISYIQC